MTFDFELLRHLWQHNLLDDVLLFGAAVFIAGVGFGMWMVWRAIKRDWE